MRCSYGWAKKGSRAFLPTTSPNIGRFSVFFHRHILWKIEMTSSKQVNNFREVLCWSWTWPTGTEVTDIKWHFALKKMLNHHIYRNSAVWRWIYSVSYDGIKRSSWRYLWWPWALTPLWKQIKGNMRDSVLFRRIPTRRVPIRRISFCGIIK